MKKSIGAGYLRSRWSLFGIIVRIGDEDDVRMQLQPL